VKEAVPRLTEALRHYPPHADAHHLLGIIMIQRGSYALAIPQFRAVIKERPTDADAHFQLAYCLKMTGKAEEAIASYRQALRLRPDWTDAMNNLAWLLATHPDEKIRNGAEALRLAGTAYNATRRRVPLSLDTLAAALAETGRLEDAAKTEAAAVAAAEQIGDKQLAEQFRNRPYAQGKPHRENPTSRPAITPAQPTTAPTTAPRAQ
jgi:Flp pilus assembly protein TadD